MTALQGQVNEVPVKFMSEFIDACMCINIHVEVQIHTDSCNSKIIPEFPVKWEIALLSEKNFMLVQIF